MDSTVQEMTEQTYLGRDLDLTRFEAWLREEGKSRNTVRSYVNSVRRLLEWADEKLGMVVPLEQITSTDVQDCRDGLLEAGTATSTVNSMIYSVRALCDFLGKPQFPIKGVQVTGTAERGLTDAEYNRLIRTVQRGYGHPPDSPRNLVTRDGALLALLLGAGLRREEASRVLVKDVTIRARSGHVRVRYGKGGKQRVPPIPARYRELIQARLEELYEQHPGEDIQDLPLLGGIKPDGISKRVRRWGQAANIPDLHAHMLRRTRAQRWLKVTNESQISLWLGHSRVEVTRIYTGIAPGDEDFEKIDND